MRIFWNIFRAVVVAYFGVEALKLFQTKPGIAIALGCIGLLFLVWTIMDIFAGASSIGSSSDSKVASCCYSGIPICPIIPTEKGTICICPFGVFGYGESC